MQHYRSHTLTREQINQVITTQPWREIQSSSDQTVCPINQTEFSDDEMVSRINSCGHIFSTNAINNYLLNYDNRCPVCRINLSRNNTITSNTTTQNATTQNATTQNATQNATTQNNNTTTRLSNDITTAVNIATNAVVNELTNSLINGENTPEHITAEYSLFLPNTTNTIDNSRINWTTTPLWNSSLRNIPNTASTSNTSSTATRESTTSRASTANTADNNSLNSFTNRVSSQRPQSDAAICNNLC